MLPRKRDSVRMRPNRSRMGFSLLRQIGSPTLRSHSLSLVPLRFVLSDRFWVAQSATLTFRTLSSTVKPTMASLATAQP